MRALTVRVAIFGSVFGSVFGSGVTGHTADNIASANPEAQPGECYARVVIPAQFRTESSTIVVRQATETLKIIPAKFDWIEERYIVSEATTDTHSMPAQYKTRTDTIEISPAETIWVIGSKYSTVEANPGLLSLAESNGAGIASAEPGQCFTEYYKEAQYKDVTERVLVAQESESIRVIPARYKWVEEKQLIAAASRLVEIPAVFETVQERVKVEDARVEWKRGRGGIERIDNFTGDVMCLVEIPAVYKTIEKRVMKSPAATRVMDAPVRFSTNMVRKLVEPARAVRTKIPARYREVTKRVKTANAKHFWRNTEDTSELSAVRKTGALLCNKEIPARSIAISRTVVAKPASVKTIEIPARYETRKVRRLLSEAIESRVTIPAETRQVARRIKVDDPKLEWRQVLCETNTTSRSVTGVQRALDSAGFDVGDINGELTEETMSAIEKYQREHDLATGGLTIELLQNLGVNPG